MDQYADKHGANYLFFVLSICIICVCLHASAFSFVYFIAMWIKLLQKRFGSRDGQNAFICAQSGSWPQGWRYSHFSSYVSLDPASTIHPPKISRISSTQKDCLKF